MAKAQYESKPFVSNRAVMIFVLLLLLAIILLLLWWFLFRDSDDQAIQPPPTADETVVLPPSQPDLPNTTSTLEYTPPVYEPGELEVLRLARNFTERYGSWSTEAKFRNLEELYPSITGSLQREFESTINAAEENPSFVGYDTYVIKITITDLQASSASVIVNTQRVEKKPPAADRVFYQIMDLSMVRQGDFWYVDTAEWAL